MGDSKAFKAYYTLILSTQPVDGLVAFSGERHKVTRRHHEITADILVSRTHRGSLLRFFRKKEEEEKPATHTQVVDNKEKSAERELFSRRFGWVG